MIAWLKFEEKRTDPTASLYVASDSGISGESCSLAIRSSPRPLRRAIRVADLSGELLLSSPLLSCLGPLSHARGDEEGYIRVSENVACLSAVTVTVTVHASLAMVRTSQLTSDRLASSGSRKHGSSLSVSSFHIKTGSMLWCELTPGSA